MLLLLASAGCKDPPLAVLLLLRPLAVLLLLRKHTGAWLRKGARIYYWHSCCCFVSTGEDYWLQEGNS